MRRARTASASAAGAGAVYLTHRLTRLIWCGDVWGWQQSSLTAVPFSCGDEALAFAVSRGFDADVIPAPPSGHLWVPDTVARCEECGRTLAGCEGHDPDPRR